MSLKCGIVGLPNVGKSTLFNALTKAGIAAENYPFCTIEPNVGVVEVPDPRLAQLSDIVVPERVVPAIPSTSSGPAAASCAGVGTPVNSSTRSPACAAVASVSEAPVKSSP